ncbi:MULTISPECIES: TIGR03943 family putative permease subunit [unclassified Peribacillus]|uniref:TIGR03943 family putative permease subunit n=1 Tax=unclassified Peribacillus TaxID=2675266 RepID=UPI001913F5A0|nr:MULTISPECIES: TIGR03943 family protein [unclassified Peribacillus]MBK5502275.1 TIGR03943 family protein [Peribacillus sp. TH14]WMX57805.1 TIGR03943 family protein [Peribacillus sp. R9-11]
MVRLFILLGLTFLFMHLHASGNISKYINMEYSYVSQIAIYILAIFTLMGSYLYLKEGDQEECEECHRGHDHSHENKVWKKILTYSLFLIPIFTGLFLPVATMDSNIVEKKGFHFPVYDDTDEYSQHQFLQPDTSLYYGKDDYLTLMDQSLQNLVEHNSLHLTDENYLTDLEAIYYSPGKFTGKQITLTGFSYNSEDVAKNQVFLFRFGIIHCVADSGAFGMLIEFPEGMNPKNDEWYSVTGELETIYYQPFKKTIPILKVSSYNKTVEPKDPYVYRQY